MATRERARPCIHDLDRIVGIRFIPRDIPEQRLRVSRFAVTLLVLATAIRIRAWTTFTRRPRFWNIRQRAERARFHCFKRGLLRLLSRGHPTLDQIELRLIEQYAGMP